MITIEGLTYRQKTLADLIWECEDQEAVNKLLKSLPTPEFRKDAEAVIELMQLAFLDQCVSTDLAEDVLAKFKK